MPYSSFGTFLNMYSTGKSNFADGSFSCARMKSYILKSSAGKPIIVSTIPMPAGMPMAQEPPYSAFWNR